jgi:alkylated DNA repair dioxygenase AlkB
MDLHHLHQHFPDGFSYLEDFISEQEEQELIADIQNDVTLHYFQFQGFQARRRTASFGFDYSFDQRKLNPGQPIPQKFLPLLKKVETHLSIPEHDLAEMLVTEYSPGSVINWHRDAPPFNLIAGISLASDCMFKMRPHNEVKRKRSSVLSIPVLRRSLYVMRGPSRFDWQHRIAPVKATRYSITFRTLLK